MRCDICVHWKVDEHDWEATAVGFGECKAVRERWTIQDEASEGLDWDGSDDDEYSKVRAAALRKSMAYVQDGSQYHAELLTAPNFFCALFMAKPDEPQIEPQKLTSGDAS